jgi:O-antigen/teichoic acid export membrane protein
MLVSTLSYSVMPRLARHFAEGEIAAFRRLLLGLTGLSAALGGVGVLAALVAGRPLLSLVYTPEYGAYSGLFGWIMLAAGVGYVTAGWDTAMTAVRCFHVQLPLILTVLGATLATCIWAIPRLGLSGAALAMLAGAVTHAVGGGWVVLRAARRRAQEMTPE